MPTTIISFLGTGKKITPNDPRSGYQTANYGFALPGGGHRCIQTSLFGAALLRFTIEQKIDVDRWIVLGTSASVWSELNQVLPDPNSVLEEYFQIDERVATKTVDAQSLLEWQNTLKSRGAPLDLFLCLTGEALDPNSQSQIVQALFQNVPRGNDLVFDITHGFRHQPVIATFLVSLMRWTHSIKKVSLFSGVFEATKNEVTPVLELPICLELVEAAEAAAILNVTGNYEPVAKRFGLDASLPWFLENTNQVANAKTHAQKIQTGLTGLTNPIDQELAELLKGRLEWTNQGTFAQRCFQSAKTALDRGDYFRAVVMTYESILIHAGIIALPVGDAMNYLYRQACENVLKERLWGDNRETFINLQWIRNSCAHGTRPDRGDSQKLLQNPSEFSNHLRKAFLLFDRLPTLLNFVPK